MEQPIIELKDVTIELAGECILHDINLSVKHGEVIVLIGPSGSGKTVLLKTMAGLFAPKKGQVLCLNREWQDLTLTDRHDLAQKIGMQFQRSALFDDISAFDNIAFVLREHHALSEDKIPIRVTECLTAVGLEKAKDLFAHEMSGGMKQRLGIARAIALKPEILFMDDPTAGLDPFNSDAMAELILNLKKEIDATLIIVTHDMMRAYQFAGRIFFIAGKTVLETGSAEQTKMHRDPRVQQFVQGKIKGPLIETDY